MKSRHWFIPLTLMVAGFQAVAAPGFQSAQPIWPAGRETEMNLSVGFRAVFESRPGQRVLLRATGSSAYRVWLNGAFLAYGPARGPHGFYRVDEIDLTGKTVPGTNLVAFEAAGYNVNSYYLLDQPAFLQAEVVSGDRVLAATGAQPRFEAQVLNERVQKVQRFSFQRPFSEVYRLKPGFDAWRLDPAAKLADAPCEALDPRRLLPRGISFPDHSRRGIARAVAAGKLQAGIKVEKPWKDRCLTQVGPKFKGYVESELEIIPSLEVQTLSNATFQAVAPDEGAADAMTLGPLEFRLLDFGQNLSGFLGAQVVCETATRLYLTWDEILTKGDVDFKRGDCVNALLYELEPGTYNVESFEPYTLRYLKVAAVAGQCRVSGIYLREYADPNCQAAHFACNDERLTRIFAAGRETFRQNAVDVFMDCPSRERAGWLCDSFYTARVALDLCGDTRIERNFFENFALPQQFDSLPDGVLPMCYPADHNDGVFISNWTMWFVVQLEEYLERSGDRATVDALRPRVLKLIDYLKTFQNADGLLEKLPSWVFLEWSKANDFVQDVNYPSNMLFARALAAAGKLYAVPALTEEAQRIRATILQQSFDGSYFVDNAKRIDGKLVITTNRSETCQYYAYYFGTATPESHPVLWNRLVKEFGGQRKETKAHPEIHAANMFPGLNMRMELLARNGLVTEFLEESTRVLLPMAEQTGTLWENDTPSASCNHGFASHIDHLLFNTALGVRKIDIVNKTVQIHFLSGPLSWCEGTLPVPEGRVSLRWRKNGNKIQFSLLLPAGYAVQTSAGPGLSAERIY